MRVAVLGAGYAGLSLARTLERRLPPEADLVVVDEDDYHLVQHEIHRAIRRPEVADDLRVPLADVLDDATIRQARVTDVDTDASEATLEPLVPIGGDGPDTDDEGTNDVEFSGETETLDYDVGVVALGAQTAFYDLSGVADHATPLKRLGDAADIRADFLDIVDSGGGRIVVGGAGLSGVQTAGELAALAREEGVSEDVEILLLEQERAVAPNFPPQFQRAVETELLDRDVVVRTGTAVQAADDETLTLEGGETVEYDALVWTGGIRGQDAMAGDRPVVRDHLRYEGETFVVGDAARVVDVDGSAVPASAQSAIRAANVAADNVVRLVEHRLADVDGFEPRLDRFQFDSPGWLVSVGDGAVAQVGEMVVTGPPAIALKTTVGAGYLTTVGAVRKAVGLVQEEVSMATGSIPADVEEQLPDDLGDPEDALPADELGDPADSQTDPGAGDSTPHAGDDDDGPIDVDVTDEEDDANA
jgi:NADH dehydrogenase